MKGKRLASLILSLLAVVAVTAFAPRLPVQQEADISSPTLRIPYSDFKPLYDANKVVVIDTRDPASFDMGHIPGARLIPADDIGKHVDQLRKLHKPIVTYCS